jgi:hypothetical protein
VAPVSFPQTVVTKSPTVHGTEASPQELYHAKQDAFAGNATDLEAYGFRQGRQLVKVVAAVAITYCMQAPGGTNTFKMTQDTGLPVSGTC